MIRSIHNGLGYVNYRVNYVNIRTDDCSYYQNIYLDNLQRDFPIWNSYTTINLGLINDNINNDIRQAIKQKYLNFDVNQISIVDKTNYSYFSKIFSAKIYVSTDSQYSFGNLRPTFTYITKTKLKEISNYIANHNLTKQWIEHINDWITTTFPIKMKTLNVDIQLLKDTYPLGKELDNKINIKKQEMKVDQKEILRNYIREWSYVSTLVSHELELDELNKNVQGLKTSFETIKNQVNDLNNRIQILENVWNWNCANIVGIAGGVIFVIPVIGTIGGAVATINAGACAIAGV
ncbi:hypothetical protein [Spiroplasma endosymbiont of Polydrusus pterygomalis]|uniref:hypothetical protein n=1 Tax=Spiroplasma endosymbiont of Polydrusus pterygomalis TaxID=3139327 RepID=UPI003CCAFA8E